MFTQLKREGRKKKEEKKQLYMKINKQQQTKKSSKSRDPASFYFDPHNV